MTIRGQASDHPFYIPDEGSKCFSDVIGNFGRTAMEDAMHQIVYAPTGSAVSSILDDPPKPNRKCCPSQAVLFWDAEAVKDAIEKLESAHSICCALETQSAVPAAKLIRETLRYFNA